MNATTYICRSLCQYTSKVPCIREVSSFRTPTVITVTPISASTPTSTSTSTSASTTAPTSATPTSTRNRLTDRSPYGARKFSIQNEFPTPSSTHPRLFYKHHANGSKHTPIKLHYERDKLFDNAVLNNTNALNLADQTSTYNVCMRVRVRVIIIIVPHLASPHILGTRF